MAYESLLLASSDKFNHRYSNGRLVMFGQPSCFKCLFSSFILFLRTGFYLHPINAHLVNAFIHSFIHSFTNRFTCSLLQSFTNQSIHSSFIRKATLNLLNTKELILKRFLCDTKNSTMGSSDWGKEPS